MFPPNIQKKHLVAIQGGPARAHAPAPPEDLPALSAVRAGGDEMLFNGLILLNHRGFWRWVQRPSGGLALEDRPEDCSRAYSAAWSTIAKFNTWETTPFYQWVSRIADQRLSIGPGGARRKKRDGRARSGSVAIPGHSLYAPLMRASGGEQPAGEPCGLVHTGGRGRDAALGDLARDYRHVSNAVP